jgi:hypothetical protein
MTLIKTSEPYKLQAFHSLSLSACLALNPTFFYPERRQVDLDREKTNTQNFLSLENLQWQAASVLFSLHQQNAPYITPPSCPTRTRIPQTDTPQTNAPNPTPLLQLLRHQSRRGTSCSVYSVTSQELVAL